MFNIATYRTNFIKPATTKCNRHARLLLKVVLLLITIFYVYLDWINNADTIVARMLVGEY
jgi:hypothetical protein